MEGTRLRTCQVFVEDFSVCSCCLLSLGASIGRIMIHLIFLLHPPKHRKSGGWLTFDFGEGTGNLWFFLSVDIQDPGIHHLRGWNLYTFLPCSKYSRPASKALSNKLVFTVIHNFSSHRFWRFSLSSMFWMGKAFQIAETCVEEHCSALRSWELWRHKQESLIPPSVGILLNILKWRENIFSSADGENKKSSLPVFLTESEIKLSKHICFYIFICLWVYITAIVFSCTCEMFTLTSKIKIKHQLSDRPVKYKFQEMEWGHFSEIAVLKSKKWPAALF